MKLPQPLLLHTTILMIGMCFRSSMAVRPFARLPNGNFKVSVDKLRGTIQKNTAQVKRAVSTKKPKAAAAPKPVAAATSSSNSLLAFPKEHPFAFQLLIATLKTSAADLVVQMVAEGKSLNEVDWKRNGIFVVFGFAYLGGFQWFLMVHKYRQWFPTMDKFAKLSLAEKLKYNAGMVDAVKMVLFDLCIHMPLLYFPTYYAVKEFVSGDSWSPIDWVKDGVVTKYVNTNIKDDLTAMVQLWGPSDCIQFMLPVHLRMPFRHLVSFFWTAYVSFTRGAIVGSTGGQPPLTTTSS